MAPYAAGTTVTVEKSRAQIEALLKRQGARKVASVWEETYSAVLFEHGQRCYRIGLAMPRPTPAQRHLPPARVERELRAVERQRWRVLLLVVKAKVTAIAEGVSSVEEAFLGDTIVQDGRTLAEHDAAGALSLAHEGRALKLPPPRAA